MLIELDEHNFIKEIIKVLLQPCLFLPPFLLKIFPLAFFGNDHKRESPAWVLITPALNPWIFFHCFLFLSTFHHSSRHNFYCDRDYTTSNGTLKEELGVKRFCFECEFRYFFKIKWKKYSKLWLQLSSPCLPVTPKLMHEFKEIAIVILS